MCWYECFKYSCQDFKVGNFKEHCDKEYRMGETCGLVMYYNTIQLPEICTLCERIERKLRRRDKAMSDYQRWAQDPNPYKYKASMEKAKEEYQTLTQEIEAIQGEKDRKYMAISGPRRRRA